MEENKMNVEVKKIKKSSKEVEWTKTLEIPYDTDNKISKEEKKQIEAQYGKKADDISTNKNENFLLNTTVLNMESNPFHQSSMNTIEFEDEDFLIQAVILKEDNSEANHEEEILALEKLLENNIITKKEFEEKKQIILSKKE